MCIWQTGRAGGESSDESCAELEEVMSGLRGAMLADGTLEESLREMGM